MLFNEMIGCFFIVVGFIVAIAGIDDNTIVAGGVLFIATGFVVMGGFPI